MYSMVKIVFLYKIERKKILYCRKIVINIILLKLNLKYLNIKFKCYRKFKCWGLLLMSKENN